MKNEMIMKSYNNIASLASKMLINNEGLGLIK
jgi:hypothetical protein